MPQIRHSEHYYEKRYKMQFFVRFGRIYLGSGLNRFRIHTSLLFQAFFRLISQEKVQIYKYKEDPTYG
jgi:hypothetical protein